MIFGNLENFKKYLSVNEKFATAFEFIERALREDLPVARYELAGSELYAFNSNVIAADSLPSQNEMNPYTSPLDRIWEIEFAE